MKKFVSLLMAVLMLCTMLSVFTVPVSAATRPYSITFVYNWPEGIEGRCKKMPTYTGDSYSATKLPIPFLEGYTFVGWCEKSDLSDTPIKEIPPHTEGDKTFYGKWRKNNAPENTVVEAPCEHTQFTKINIDKSGKDPFEAEIDFYYKCNSCGLYSESTSGQNMIGDEAALNAWLTKWYNDHIASCRYIDYSLDESRNVISTETKIDSNYFYPINTSDKAWGKANDDTWYVCVTDTTIDNRIDIIGKVHLIIRDGCTLTAKNGIHLKEGNTLSIYAQSNGENRGKLVANGGGGNAAIGGNCGANGINDFVGTPGENCGTLNVCGAAVIAEGNGTAGIGGGKGGNGYDGKAQNGGGIAGNTLGCAGGGGHGGGNGGTLNVYAGTVTAKGSVGVGGGNGGMGGKGSYQGSDSSTYFIPRLAGKSGNGGNGSNITVYGGTVNASGDTLGIGGGNGGNGQADLMLTGLSDANMKKYHPEIEYYQIGAYTYICGTGGNGGNGGDGGKLTVKGGTVLLYGKVKAAGGGECGIATGRSSSDRTLQNGNPGSDTTFDLENCVLKAGDSESDMSVVSEYNGKKYFSVQYNSVSTLGSVLSNGSIWIIAAVAVVVVAGVATLVIVKKKKKPALADGENTDE